MRELVVTSLSEIVRYIEAHCSLPGAVLFRGQPHDSPLIPSIARVRPRRPLLEAEARMLRAFQRRSLPFLEMRPESAWDWLAVAQHHGLPTRLLDWSINALSATWFAVERPAREDARGRQPAVIWLLQPREGTLEEGGDYLGSTRQGDPFKVTRTGVLVPRYVARRIVAQGGYFTVHPSSPAPPHFRPLEEEEEFRDRLVKVIIPADSFPTMRQHLSRLGINAMAIYPDLGGLCKDIAWRNTYAGDEEADPVEAAPRARRPESSSPPGARAPGPQAPGARETDGARRLTTASRRPGRSGPPKRGLAGPRQPGAS
jgi:hypothetical protein